MNKQTYDKLIILDKKVRFKRVCEKIIRIKQSTLPLAPIESIIIQWTK